MRQQVSVKPTGGVTADPPCQLRPTAVGVPRAQGPRCGRVHSLGAEETGCVQTIQPLHRSEVFQNKELQWEKSSYTEQRLWA